MLDGRLDCFVRRRARNGAVSAPHGYGPPSDRLRRSRIVGRRCLAAWGLDRTHSVKHELISIEVVGLDLDPDLLAGVHD